MTDSNPTKQAMFRIHQLESHTALQQEEQVLGSLNGHLEVSFQDLVQCHPLKNKKIKGRLLTPSQSIGKHAPVHGDAFDD
jgi:hypothetical protein